MQNNTDSNQTGNLSNPQDTLNAALLFARALSLILEDNQGIVVDVQNDVQMGEEVEKVIVFKHLDQVHIYKCDDDIVEGTAVMMSDSTANPEEETK